MSVRGDRSPPAAGRRAPDDRRAGVDHGVTTSGGSLLLQAPGQQKIPITPTGAPDTFEIELAGATIRFVRGDDSAMSELVLIQGDVEQRAKKTDG